MLLAFLLQMLLLMYAAFSAAHALDIMRITLEHTYPQDENFNLVKLQCYDTTSIVSLTLLPNALFFVNDTLITSQDSDGGVTHIITPETERGLQYLVCVSVCRTTGYGAAYERYQQLQSYKGMKNNVAILLKRLRSRDMA